MKSALSHVVRGALAMLFSIGVLPEVCAGVVVADSLSHFPIENASVFDRRGVFVGASNSRGHIPYIAPDDYPITLRYLGYMEQRLTSAGADTIFMQENPAQLPEVVVESKRQRMLHVLAYVREYSTLSTYTDTVTMFREKMEDFMLPVDGYSGYKGWRSPRIIKSQSYYHFTNANGLDSVSDRCHNHFTWSDWIGILPEAELPPGLVGVEAGVDSVPGKYGPSEIWIKTGDRVSINLNLLADKSARKWVPGLSPFFSNGNIDFERFRLRYNYGDIVDAAVSPVDLTGYTFNVESRGRGHEMFRFHRPVAPFFVTTYTEVYMLDKEYITVKEAKKWERHKFKPDEIQIYEPAEAPPLEASVQRIIDRVNNIDTDEVRTSTAPDLRMVSKPARKRHFGHRVLDLLKAATGISDYRSKRKVEGQWKKFKRDQAVKNRALPHNDE